MNYACICLYIMACRVYNKFSVWVSTRGNSLSLSLLLFSLHVAISCCYIGDPDDPDDSLFRVLKHALSSNHWTCAGISYSLDIASPHALSLHPLVSLVLTTRLSGSLTTTTHCRTALIITHWPRRLTVGQHSFSLTFTFLWLITQPSRCLSPTDPLMIDSEKS